MSNRKGYIRPEIRTENITVGVYGDYGNGNDDGCGGNGGNGGGWNPINIFNPLFHWCCS